MTWFMFWMWVAFSAVSAILQKAPSGFKDSGSWTKPSAEEGKTIPIVLGTCRLRGPNCLWFGDVSSKSIKKKSGGFMGIGAKKVKVGCKYFCGCVLGLSTTIDAVLDIIVGDKSFADAGVSFPWTYSASGTTKTIALDNLFGGKESEGGISGKLSFYFGSDSQTGNAYYAAKRGKSAPGFRGMCYIVLEKMYIGTMKYMKEWHFVVRHCPTPTGMDSAKANIDGDANPAHGAAYLMTTPKSKGGMGISISRLDISSFNTAATTLFNEGLGISLLIDDAQSADTWLATIRQTIDAAIYTDPVTGLWTMKLIRADYTPSNLTEFADADCVSNPKMTRPSWADTINKVIVRYNSRANGFTIRTVSDRDPGNRAVQGIDRVQTMDFPAISKLANARIVAARERKQLSYPVAAFELTLKRKAWSLRPGSAFLLTSTFLGISKMPCRVINIKYGALEVGEIQVEATEDIFGVATTAYTGSTSSSWSNPSSLPVAVAYQKMVEAPFAIVGSERNVFAMGTRGDTITEDLDVWVNESNGYLEANTIDPAPSGTLQAIWSAKTAAKDMTGFIIAGTDLDTLLDANTNADGCARGVNLALVDDEWISWTTCTDNGDGTYTIAGVLRGIFDSVPADHASGARVWFLTEGCSLTQISSAGSGAGSPGADGQDGIDGADGNTVLSGAGDPTSSDGVNGDYWINTTTHYLFGPKTGGVWPAGVSLVGGGSSSSIDSARVYRNSAYTTSVTAWQKVPLNTVDYDTNSIWDATNTRFVPKQAGYYLCIGRVRLNSQGTIALAIGKNGSESYAIGSDSAGYVFAIGGSGLIYCNGTTDYLELYAYLLTGKAITTGTQFDTYLEIVGPFAKASGDLGWHTALDLDFSSQASQTLSADGTYTIAGKTWTKYNSTNDNVAMAIVNGSGLVIQPKSASDAWKTSWTTPGLKIPLQMLIPNVTLDTPLRMTLYVSSENRAANYDFAGFGLGNIANLTYPCVINARLGYSAGKMTQVVACGANTDYASPYISETANTVRVTLPNGISGSAYKLASLTKATFPASNELVAKYRGNTSNQVVSSLTTVADWFAHVCAGRAGSATALSMTIARIKLEYLPLY